MSLNKTLDRLFDEIRREARRNPEFADRLDYVLRAHVSRREEPVWGPDEAPGGAADEARADGAGGALNGGARDAARQGAPPASAAPASAEPAEYNPGGLNPVGLYLRGGEDALAAALEGEGLPNLLALVREHNLDPAGDAEGLDRDALAAHVLAQAKRRAERDKKLFDY